MKYIENALMEKLYLQIKQLNENLEIVTPNNDRGILGTNAKVTFMYGIKSSSRSEYHRFCLFRKLLMEILKDLGIKNSNLGYFYILDSVRIIIDLQTLNIQLNNDVYPEVAKLNGISNYKKIEHSIRNAIMSACRSTPPNTGINGISIFNGRVPQNKEFLFYIAELVVERMLQLEMFNDMK